MTEKWPLPLIQSIIMEREFDAVSPLNSSSKRIKIITFDSYGLSGHPNHIAIYEACQSLPVEVYNLLSVPLWRKYLSIFDAMHILGRKLDNVVYITNLSETIRIKSAMINGHVSQMVWYRWGWLIFSRFQVINELKLQNRLQ